jgi:citrate synthase
MPEYVPGLAGVPAAESKICSIDGQKGVLKYRGYTAETLAENSNFEETAYLLLEGKLPNRAEQGAFNADLRRHRRLKYRIIDLLKCLPESGHPMDALVASVAALGMFYKSVEPTDPKDQYEASVRLIAKVPTIIAAFHRMRRGDRDIAPRENLDHASNFLYMLDEREPDPLAAKVLDVCLILHAEHSMNASTFAARVTGSTLADPYAVVSSAIGTLAGPLHGGANEDVLSMLRRIGSAENVEAFVERKVQAKEKIVGFGHREYKVKDPRAKILEQLAVKLFDRFGATPLYDIARALEAAVERRLGAKGVYPNVDFYSGIVYDRLGITTDLFTPIFAMARVTGWLAHWREQVQNNRIFRPSQLYVGAESAQYLPLDQR